MPRLAVDTTLVAAQILVNSSLIVSRSIDPLKRVIITAGTFKTEKRTQCYSKYSRTGGLCS